MINKEIKEFIEHNSILMLANIGLDGLPKIRPMITLGFLEKHYGLQLLKVNLYIRSFKKIII